MNLTALLNFESMQYKGAQTQASAINIFVANALRVFISDFYQRIAPAFIVIISCRRPSPMNFYRNIMQLLYDSVDDMIVQLVLHNQSAPQHIPGPRLHNLLLVDSLEALLDVEIHTYNANADTNEYYYIFLQQRDARIPGDMQAIFEYCWRYQLINCNVQIQNSRGEVTMHTYFPYAATHCAHILPVQINRFLGHAWQHSSYFPSKLHNFYQCPLHVIVRNEIPFMRVSETSGTGKRDNQSGYVLQGLEGLLLAEIATRLNFSMRISVMHSQANAEHSMLTALQQHSAQLAVGYIRKRVKFQHNLTSVFPHYPNTIISCVLLKAHNLTSYQIFSFPFKSLTWLSLVTIFGSISACLIVYQHYQQRPDNGASVLSLFAVVFGIPVVKLPKRTSSQLFLTGWLYFTFLVRTMYSALLFHLQRSNAHQPLPSTLVGMLRADFTAVLNRITFNDIGEIPYYDQFRDGGVTIIDTSNENEVLQHLEMHETRRLVGVISRDILHYYTNDDRRARMYYTAPEYVMQQQLAIYLQKHSYLVHQFDELVMAIQAVGLMEYWSRILENEKHFANTPATSDVQLLRQRELMAIYVLSLGTYALAFLIFLFEFYAHSKRHKIKTNK